MKVGTIAQNTIVSSAESLATSMRELMSVVELMRNSQADSITVRNPEVLAKSVKAIAEIARSIKADSASNLPLRKI